MAADDKVVIGITHGADDAEQVLIGYLMGVEALNAGKQALLFLTADGSNLAMKGYASTVEVPNAPSVADLHERYVQGGGKIFVCPVCVKVRGLDESQMVDGVEIKGAPSVYEFASGGALTFNY